LCRYIGINGSCAAISEPVLAGQQPDRDLGLQTALLGKPGSRNPSARLVSKYSVYADLLVMPMFGVLSQVRLPGWFLRSA
jgi:hypothetical protein